MSNAAKKKPQPSLSLAEVKARLLRSGKITEQSLTEARRELDNDPEWQAFETSQPKPANT